MTIAQANENLAPYSRGQELHGYNLTPPWIAAPHNALSFEHRQFVTTAIPAGQGITDLWTLDVPEVLAAKMTGYAIKVPAGLVGNALLDQIAVNVYDRAGPLPYCEAATIRHLLEFHGEAGLVGGLQQTYAHAKIPFQRLYSPRSRIRIVAITGIGFPGFGESEIVVKVYGWLWAFKPGLDPEY
jgi:hypothetical protein